MARGLNKLLLLGNLGKDPEFKTFPDGGRVCNATLATSESWKGRDGQPQEHTEWHNLVFREGLAEVASKYLRKGSKIYVEGSLRTRKYQDKDGKDRFIVEVRVKEMQMLDGKGSGGSADDSREGGNESRGGRAESAPAGGMGHQGGGIDDDIPFHAGSRRYFLTS